MKITKETLRKLIVDQIREGIEDIEGEMVVTAGDGDASPEARAGARLEDAIRFLEANEREDLAEPLRKVQELIDALG